MDNDDDSDEESPGAKTGGNLLPDTYVLATLQNRISQVRKDQAKSTPPGVRDVNSTNEADKKEIRFDLPPLTLFSPPKKIFQTPKFSYPAKIPHIINHHRQQPLDDICARILRRINRAVDSGNFLSKYLAPFVHNDFPSLAPRYNSGFLLIPIERAKMRNVFFVFFFVALRWFNPPPPVKEGKFRYWVQLIELLQSYSKLKLKLFGDMLSPPLNSKKSHGAGKWNR